MNTTENFPTEDDSLLVPEFVIALQKQLNESFKQLSPPDRLRVLADLRFIWQMLKVSRRLRSYGQFQVCLSV